MAMDALSSALGFSERAYRARRIGLTFGKIYLGIKTQQFISRVLAPPDMADRWSHFHRESAESIYEAAVELQGLILKGCQFVGSRADIIPSEYSDNLSRLQDRVPHRPWDEVRDLLEDEFELPLREVFREICHEPVASASLAQVHEAYLHDGERVAVKVQYPDVADLVISDLANLRALFGAVGLIEKDVDLMPLVEELGNHVPLELDFLNELENAATIDTFFSDRDDIATPRLHRELSTKRVLVMEFIDGIKISDLEALGRAGIEPSSVMRILVEAYGEQILRRGFFHADPHPGNLLVRPRPDGEGPQVVFLDFGLAKQMPRDFRSGSIDFATALFKGDADAMAEALVAVGFQTRDGDRDCLREISRIVLRAGADLRANTGNRSRELRRYGRDISRLVRENPIVTMPSHVVLLGRVIALLSGLSKSLEVKLDLMTTLLPYVFGDDERHNS